MTSSTSAVSDKWAHRLFQDPAMVEPVPHPKMSAGRQPSVVSSGPASAPDHLGKRVTTFGPQSYSLQGSDGEKWKPKGRVTVSRLAFPFNSRHKLVPPGPPSPPSPIPKPSHEPPPRRKHEHRPSPLGRASESSATASVATPTSALRKPTARYHGYSGHSLLFSKWVWSTRQAQYEARATSEADGNAASVCEALPKMLTTHPNYLRLRRMRSFYTEEKRPAQPPLTVYPRQGDIAALRDPYCARADRSFAGVPLWTLRKIVCLYALLLAKQEDAFEEAGSEVSFGTDSTLVDSDTEWDISTTCSSRHDDDTIHSDHAPISKGNLLSLAVHRAHVEPDVPTDHMSTIVWLCKFYRKPSFKLSPNQTWPSSWYGLWEVLIELARLDASSVQKAPEANKLRPPKEFRWLKLLGGPKVAKSPVASPQRSPCQSTFLMASHPAAG
ncbi:hypothetical protein H1R20_g2943, partial [Candolleomyces eurysporus]